LQHDGEPWPYKSIGDAMKNDFLGSIKHGLHDAILGNNELKENARATQGVIDLFRQKASEAGIDPNKALKANFPPNFKPGDGGVRQ